MSSAAAEIRKLLRQQTALARFGSFALRQTDLAVVLSEAARVCAEGLSVPFCKICRYRHEQDDLLIEAGYGWRAGVIGNVVSRADGSTPQGRAFSTGQPAICNDLRRDTEFHLPGFYAEHHIVSTIDVVIKGADRPYGVLEIDNDEQHDYDQQDVDFLTGFANVVAEAVATSTRTDILRTTIAQMAVLVAEKNRLLEQKMVLAEELQHRVRNNLQLIYAMLSQQLASTMDKVARRGIKSIARRVFTLGQVYDHLLGTELTRTTDLGGYICALCVNLAEIQAASHSVVRLVCEASPMPLELDVVTVLGLVVAELVTNCYDHAFPAGQGEIRVTLRPTPDDAATATLCVRDDGKGFSAAGESKRHGIGLVRRLVAQAGGTLTLTKDAGTCWTVVFPATVPA